MHDTVTRHGVMTTTACISIAYQRQGCDRPVPASRLVSADVRCRTACPQSRSAVPVPGTMGVRMYFPGTNRSRLRYRARLRYGFRPRHRFQRLALTLQDVTVPLLAAKFADRIRMMPAVQSGRAHTLQPLHPESPAEDG